jgi:hypothetical protein
MDSRALIELDFRIYGQHYHYELNINYTPENDVEVDRRVTDFFRERYYDAYLEVNKKSLPDSIIDKEESIEFIERKELDRLKEKYEDEHA